MEQQQINITKNVIIELTPAQVSVVFSMLRKGVYEQVAGVLSSMESQILKQVKEPAVAKTDQPTNGVTT